jgi:DNA topoisomerase-1
VIAREAGLRYVSDTAPGIRRRRVGEQFEYIAPNGEQIEDEQTLRRIRSLAIPPAWTDVWICPSPKGHVQATGRDARGRKQYRYHPRWREVRDEAKYERVMAFAEALPRIRQQVEEDLARPGLSREKVLAAVVRLLESTLIRVGNEEYARQNRSYGLTTLRNRHVEVNGAKLEFHFRGKGDKLHRVGVRDRRLARVIRHLQELPGQELFQYVDESGQRHSIQSDDVNAYLRAISGQDFTAKDFRTWAGTVLAALAFVQVGAFESQTQARRQVVRAIEIVAARLGNTPAVCRKCYVHPGVIESYLDGTLLASLRDRVNEVAAEQAGALSGDEARVLELLRGRLAREAEAASDQSQVRRPSSAA